MTPDEPADPPHRAAAGDGGPALAPGRRLPPDRPLINLSQAAPGRAAARSPARGDGRDGPRRGRHPPLRPGPRHAGAALRDRLALESAAYGGEIRPDEVAITAGCNQAFCTIDHHPRRPRRGGDAAGSLVLQPQDVARHERHRDRARCPAATACSPTPTPPARA